MYFKVTILKTISMRSSIGSHCRERLTSLHLLLRSPLFAPLP